MIDSGTGDLITDGGLRLGPAATREGFESSAMGRSSEVSVRNEPWCSYVLPTLQVGGRAFSAILYFYENRAESIHFTLAI